MTVRVLFFAYLRDVTGTPAVELELPSGARVADVHRELVGRWPALESQLVRIPIVHNGRVVEPEAAVEDGAEIVWLPPVGGGSPASSDEEAPLAAGAGVVHAGVTAAPLDVSRLLSQVRAPSCGGIVVFVGDVRDHDGRGPVVALTYDAYDRLARTQLRAVADEAAGRWPEARIAVEHRTGRLVVGEASVVVAVAAPHRAAAFACARYVIDRVKEAVPIWKREEGAAGESRWLPGHDYRPVAAPGGEAGPGDGEGGGPGAGDGGAKDG